jgi:hypothetical protein
VCRVVVVWVVREGRVLIALEKKNHQQQKHLTCH